MFCVRWKRNGCCAEWNRVARRCRHEVSNVSPGVLPIPSRCLCLCLEFPRVSISPSVAAELLGCWEFPHTALHPEATLQILFNVAGQSFPPTSGSPDFSRKFHGDEGSCRSRFLSLHEIAPSEMPLDLLYLLSGGNMANLACFDLIAPDQKTTTRTRSGRTGPLPLGSRLLNQTPRTNVCLPSCITISRLVPFPVIKKRVYLRLRLCLFRGCGPAFRSPSLRTPTQTPTNPTTKPNLNIPMLPPTPSS